MFPSPPPDNKLNNERERSTYEVLSVVYSLQTAPADRLSKVSALSSFGLFNVYGIDCACMLARHARGWVEYDAEETTG